jgi:endonuclease/exonuclease/phosphatase family metal-dependent hydrolase
MRVVSWNVQHGVPDPEDAPDLGRAVGPLADLSADVYALQEVDQGLERTGFVDQMALVADAVGGLVVPVPAFQRGEGTYGNALVVRGAVADAEVLALPGPAEPRSAGLARVGVDGGEWSIAVTHLSLDAATARLQLEMVLRELAARPAPRVLLGDLNLETEHVRPITTASGFDLASGNPTWNARRRPRRRLDHVAVAGASITATGVSKLPVSDHLAVWADLQT